MIPRHVEEAVTAALGMLPAQMTSDKALVMLYAIGGQESGFATRVQRPRKPGGPPGPARGFWQFERGGGVKGVLTHPATEAHAQRVCHIRAVSPRFDDVWQRLGEDDVLAAAFARLLLWADPRPLPALSDQGGAWDCYLRNWRPGEPHEDRWFDNHAQAVLFVKRAA